MNTPTPRFKIINGDCIPLLRRLADGCIDLVVTDQPYLVNYRDRSGRRLRGDRSAEWLRPAFAEIGRVLKPGGLCVSFYGWNRADDFLGAWRAARLTPVEHFVFLKSYASSERLSRRTHECAYLLAKGRVRRPQLVLNSTLPWSYTGNKLHPTEKPVCALEPLIAAFSQPGDVVLDPFMGSGSTGHAARRLGRSFLGIELDPRYFERARERFAADAA
jgi:site-specific DNA-methyltransferase (adenine-specific)